MERVNCSREFVDKIRSFRNQDQPVCYTRTGVGGGQAYKSITLGYHLTGHMRLSSFQRLSTSLLYNSARSSVSTPNLFPYRFTLRMASSQTAVVRLRIPLSST